MGNSVTGTAAASPGIRPETTIFLPPTGQRRYTSRVIMPKPRQTPLPAPIQLRLFAEEASLVRIRPERNEWRFYRMEIWPDRRLDPHPDPGAALNALAAILRAKRRRGYQDRRS